MRTLSIRFLSSEAAECIQKSEAMKAICVEAENGNLGRLSALFPTHLSASIG